jgi:hypothetical protein
MKRSDRIGGVRSTPKLRQCPGPLKLLFVTRFQWAKSGMTVV